MRALVAAGPRAAARGSGRSNDREPGPLKFELMRRGATCNGSTLDGGHVGNINRPMARTDTVHNRPRASEQMPIGGVLANDVGNVVGGDPDSFGGVKNWPNTCTAGIGERSRGCSPIVLEIIHRRRFVRWWRVVRIVR